MSTLQWAVPPPQPISCPKLPRDAEGPCIVVSELTGAKYIRYVDKCSRCGWVDPASLDRWAENAHKELLDPLQQRIAMAAGLEPFAFVEQHGQPITLPEGIAQAMAAAANAWEHPELAGRYDAQLARQIGQQLYRLIQETYA